MDPSFANPSLTNPSAVESATAVENTTVIVSARVPNPGLIKAIADLGDGDFQTRWDAAKAIRAFETQAVEPLLEWVKGLETEDTLDDELLWFLARIFGDWRGPHAIAALTDLLATTADDDVVSMVAAALAKQGEAAIALLAELTAQPAQKLVAYRALACISHPDVLPLLQAAASDADADVRVVALDTLGCWRDPGSTPYLLTALSDRVAAVRQVAIAGLSSQLAIARDAERVRDWLEKLGACLTDVDTPTAEKAAIALSRSRLPRAADILGAHLQSERVPVRLQCAIARSLVWIATPESIVHLQAALHLLAPAACQEAIATLGRLEAAALRSMAAGVLLDFCERSHSLSADCRAAIAHSLGQLGDTRSLPMLQTLALDPEERVKWHAIAACERLSATRSAFEISNGDVDQRVIAPE